MKRYGFLLSLSVLAATPAFSDVACPQDAVENVQQQSSGKVVYRQSGVWRKLGTVGTAPFDAMLSVLLAAHASGLEVRVSYPDGYDCTTTDYNISAVGVTTFL